VAQICIETSFYLDCYFNGCFSPEDGTGFEVLASEAPESLSAERVAKFEQRRKEFAGRSVREVSPYVRAASVYTVEPCQRFIGNRLSMSVSMCLLSRRLLWDQIKAYVITEEVSFEYRYPWHVDNFNALVAVFPEAKQAHRGPRNASEARGCPWEPFSSQVNMWDDPMIWIAAPRKVPALAERGGPVVPQTEEAIAKAAAELVALLEDEEADELRRQRRKAARRAERELDRA